MGWLWVCYYDTRGDRSRLAAVYSCTASPDGGRGFAPPAPAASVASNERQPGADSHGFGDYEGLAVFGGVAHPIWTDSRDLDRLGEETTLGSADLYASAASPDSAAR